MKQSKEGDMGRFRGKNRKGKRCNYAIIISKIKINKKE